ncbi:MAG: hypothetical protein IT383_22855 [Deltaproteobacteria bacterium]|nr:hypothetical protein [Deltaproteobacteria bacterium]
METGDSGWYQGATWHRARAACQLCALLLSLGLAACQPVQPAPTLRTASAPAAEALVRALLDEATAKVTPTGLCDMSGEGKARAASAIGMIGGYSVDHVEPAWVGAEPYFRVDVTLRRAAGDERRAVAVRAREGCVERLWGAPLPAAQRPEPDELSL